MPRVSNGLPPPSLPLRSDLADGDPASKPPASSAGPASALPSRKRPRISDDSDEDACDRRPVPRRYTKLPPASVARKPMAVEVQPMSIEAVWQRAEESVDGPFMPSPAARALMLSDEPADRSRRGQDDCVEVPPAQQRSRPVPETSQRSEAPASKKQRGDRLNDLDDSPFSARTAHYMQKHLDESASRNRP